MRKMCDTERPAQPVAVSSSGLTTLQEDGNNIKMTDVILKATKVDGIYDKDPMVHADAVRIDTLTYLDVLQRQLKVMDSTAMAMCMDNDIPVIVFDLNTDGNVMRVVCGENIGTRVEVGPGNTEV